MERVNGSNNGSEFADFSFFTKQAILQIRKSTTFAEPRAVATSRNGAADEQIGMSHFTWSDKATILEGSTNAGSYSNASTEPLRVEFNKTFFRA